MPDQIAQLGRGTADTLDWHPAGDVLAVGGRRGLWLYDNMFADLAHFEAPGEITRLAWSPTGDRIAVLDRDGRLRLWDVALEPPALSPHRSGSFVIPGDDAVLRFSWAPQGDRLAIITNDMTRLIDVSTGEVVIGISDLNDTVTWHPDGTQIAGIVDLGDEMGRQVRTWDASSGAVIDTYNSGDPHLFWSDVQWSPDGSTLVGMTSVPATLHAWDVATGELLNDVDASAVEFGEYRGMWWINGSEQIITVFRHISPPGHSFLEIWNTSNWSTEGAGIALGDVRDISKQPNTDTWVLLTPDSQIIVRGLEEAEPLYIHSLHTQPAQVITWSSDNQHLAAAKSVGEIVHVWEFASPTETQLHVLTNPYPVLHLEELRWSTDTNTLRGILSNSIFTAPGTQIAGLIAEWDIQTGEFLDIVHETTGHIAHDGSGSFLPGNVWSADFSRVATAVNETVTVFTAATGETGWINPGEEIARINIVDYPIQIAWSPDNTMLAIIVRGPQGKTSARVYDAETGNLINRLRPSSLTTLYDVTWSPDSMMVALVGRQGITGSGETEYRLDIQEIAPLSEEGLHITTVLDTDASFYHAWHPGSSLIAVTTSSGIGIYPLDRMPTDAEASPVTLIPDVRATAITWSSDGETLAGSVVDGTIRIWEMSTIDE